MAEARPRLAVEITWVYASVARTLKFPPMTMGVPKSARFMVNRVNSTERIPGLTNGRITENSVFSGEAPRSLDARTSLWSIWSKDGSSIRDAKEMLPIIWRITMPCHP